MNLSPPSPFGVAVRIPFGLCTCFVSLCNFISISNCEICFIDVNFLSVVFRDKIINGAQKRNLKKKKPFAFLLYFGDFNQLH